MSSREDARVFATEGGIPTHPIASGKACAKGGEMMEIIRRGSDDIFGDSAPRGCCFPVGTLNFRYH